MIPRKQDGTGLVGLAPQVTLALLALPVLAGLAGALLPAFGWMPALGGTRLSLGPWRALMEWPGLSGAVRLSLVTGIAATVISLTITLLITAAWQGTRSFGAFTRLLAPLLAVPHAAAAIGLAFLIAPSGWIARLLSPWATGWERPPDLLTVGDPGGIALVAGLVVKEVPFLLLMTIAALGQADSVRSTAIAQSMGYGRVTGWLKTVLPRVYPQIRLPVFAVLAYSMSVVDMALILGPTRPPTLAVQILEWMSRPDLDLRFTAAAGAMLQAALVAGALALWWSGEWAAKALGRRWVAAGGRGHGTDPIVRPAALLMAVLCAGLVFAGLAGLTLWSLAGLWRFPAALPDALSLQSWAGQRSGLGRVGSETLLIGLIATVIALTMVVACLEAEHRGSRTGPQRALVILYLPLIVPQVAFLPGLQGIALLTGLEGGRGAVIAAHVIFVLPYVFLSLADAWRSWDARTGVVAATLGAGPGRILWTVRLPMLLRAVAVAAAVGFAVSVAQYLPTVLIGAGRVETLTTEAVALASGANRRVIGVYAAAQMLLPMIAFALALAIPALMFRNRRGLMVQQ